MYPDWKSLPSHILIAISGKLELPSDYLRFSVVCKSWQSAAYHIRDQQAKIMSNSHHPPMLLIPATEEDTWNLFNITDNKVLDMQVTVPSNYKRFCGSSKGWLIAMDEKFGVALINPFFRVKGRKETKNSIIQLPPIVHPTFPGYYEGLEYEGFLMSATISADPILHADDCIVVVSYQMHGQLAFFRLNKDTRWTDIGERPSLRKSYNMVKQVVHVDQDKFYAVDFFGRLLSFDVTSQLHSDVKVVTSGFGLYEMAYNSYLVYTNEREWLMIQRFVTYDAEFEKRKTKKFQVFRLDVDTSEWIEKKNLGGIALFLGANSLIAVSASKVTGCKPDCIYFNDDRDPDQLMVRNLPSDFDVYNFKTQRFKLPYNTCAKRLLKKSKRLPIWILPSFHL
ncbi:hypothetical protein ACLB2K_070417 [Fragaria x ananassa]